VRSLPLGRPVEGRRTDASRFDGWSALFRILPEAADRPVAGVSSTAPPSTVGQNPVMPPDVETATAEILSIGNEILLGEIVDTNANFLAGELARLGIALRQVRELPDGRERIASAFGEVWAQAELAIATGGLGPTHDDLTREGLADALGEELTVDPGLEAALRRRMGGSMPEMNLRQASLVPSAVPLANPIGSAPGWWAERDGRVAVLMPGVPSEMRRMWADQVVPRLAERFALRPLHMRTVKTFGIGESMVAERLGSVLATVDPDAGVYARDDGVHVRFSTRGDASLLDSLVAQAVAALGDGVYGLDDETLPRLALSRLARAGVRTLATQESGTDAALLAILGAQPPSPGLAAFVGGSLLVRPQVSADALLSLSLGEQDGHGRSEVSVSLSGSIVSFEQREVRIHGSGPQRLRRAAFAALDVLRRELA
jgi:nicotinamide-nucleotide amidase